MEIKVGKTYNYFDDGKIKESRKLSVVITGVVPFENIDKETLKNWEEGVEECYWLYAEKTDYFIFGILEIVKGSEEKVVFVRTIDNNWFSLGNWGGMLDVSGELTKYIEENS